MENRKKNKKDSSLYIERETFYDSQYLDELFRDIYARIGRLEAIENESRFRDGDAQLPNSKKFNYTQDHERI